ncbi:MAG TPA: hypothetical protein VGR22_10890 [Thermomicrobiales bacterium]|nr:hypothetical protein [Thermomicrobiales bacterium]
MSNKNHEERIVRYTAEEIDEMLARGESKTDWERVRNMTEEELEASIDVEEEGEFDWDTVYVGMPPVPAKKRVTLWYDFDVIEWFQNQGPD